MKQLILVIIFFCYENCFSQAGSCANIYDSIYNQLKLILENNSKKSFFNAVLLVENNYDNDTYDYNSNLENIYDVVISKLSSSFVKYYFKDSTNYKINASICSILKDTTKFNLGDTIISVPPFTFNHSDPLGKKDITNSFVSKLLATHQGNCRSLTYLYKILADQFGAKCWIALAPGHMYIKNYSEKIGWYNTELTSGTFPTDAYIMASSYINPTAVMSGMYMDTLSNQQAITLSVLDLAHLYERETKNYYDGFILKCCNLVLQYHPVNPMALLLKAETLKKMAIREKSSKFPKPTRTPKEMEETYLKLFELGYREMPYKMKKQKQKEEKENLKKYRQKQGKSNIP
jgi:hypothetical protein